MFKRKNDNLPTQQITKETPDNIQNSAKDSVDKSKKFYLNLPMYRNIAGHEENTQQQVNKEILSILKTTPLFRELTLRELKKIALLFFLRKYDEGEYLFREGNPGSAVFIIKTGKVLIQKNNDPIQKPEHFGVKKLDYQSSCTHIYAELNDGALFGEMSLMDDAVRSTDAQCVKQSEILVLFRHDMIDLFGKEPTLGVKVLKKLVLMLGERLQKNTQDLIESSLQNQKLKQYVEEIQQESQPKIKTLKEVLQQEFILERGV